MVDPELIGKHIEHHLAIYGTWEAFGGCEILPRGVGTICRPVLEISKFSKHLVFDNISIFDTGHVLLDAEISSRY